MSEARGRFVDEYLGYLLGQANHALYRDFDSHVRAAGLSSVEWRVLATLHDSRRSRSPAGARRAVQAAPVTKLVHAVRAGWLALQADAATAPHAGDGHAGGKRWCVAAGKARTTSGHAAVPAATERTALKKLLAKLAQRPQ